MLRHVRQGIFGSGLSGFKQGITPYKDVSNYHEDLIYPHNIFLNFWTETGLLGLVAITWLILDWALRTYRTMQLQTIYRPYYLGLAAASVTIFVHGMLDVPYFKNDLAFMTMAFIGLQVAAMRADRPLETGGAALAVALP